VSSEVDPAAAVAAEAGTSRFADLDRPLFVGGTGRSGTHAMARLLGRHSAYYYFSREMRFHTDRGGFPDLLAGRTSPESFLEAMRGPFWHRIGADGQPRGLYAKFSQEAYEAALEEFGRRATADPRDACRALMHSLLDPLAADAGKETWIEQTPPTVMVADTLYEVFPRMKMIHMVRDGRDVACSVLRKAWGPDSLTGAISWWEDRLRRCHEATRDLPGERVLHIHLEDLVENARQDTYERVLDFLGVEDEPPTRRFFKRRMTPEAASIGRWRTDVAPSDMDKLNRAYRRSLERMERDGIPLAPTLERADLPPEEGERSLLSRIYAGRRR
jgi:hypothetical protein